MGRQGLGKEVGFLTPENIVEIMFRSKEQWNKISTYVAQVSKVKKYEEYEK